MAAFDSKEYSTCKINLDWGNPKIEEEFDWNTLLSRPKDLEVNYDWSIQKDSEEEFDWNTIPSCPKDLEVNYDWSIQKDSEEEFDWNTIPSCPKDLEVNYD